MSTPSTLATRARDVATEMAAQATILHTFPPAVMVLSDAAAEAARIEVIRQQANSRGMDSESKNVRGRDQEGNEARGAL